MSAIYLLIPLAMIVLAISIWLFFWAVKRGQFDDLDSPGHSILLDDKNIVEAKPQRTAVEPPKKDETPELSRRD